MKKSFLSHVLVWLTVVVTLVLILQNSEKFLTPYDHSHMGTIYSNSQYVKGPAATTGIGDDGLIAVAGYYLVFQGGIPTQVNYEHPPFGEYLTGLSILFFKNERFINIFYLVLLLVITYKLLILIFDNKAVSSFGLFLLSMDPMIREHLRTSLLDLPLTLFCVISLYFFILSIRVKPWYFFVSSLFLGIAFSTKFFPGMVFFLVAMLLYLIVTRRQYVRLWVLSLSLIPLVYTLSYTMFFVHGNSFIDFIDFHKWIFNWRLGNPAVPGNIVTTFLFGKYRSWWESGGWVSYTEWSIVSPLIFFGGLFSVLHLPKSLKDLRFFIYVVVLLYVIYAGVGTTGLSKYVFPVYPLLAGLASFFFYTLFQRRLQILSDILTKRWKNQPKQKRLHRK